VCGAGGRGRRLRERQIGLLTPADIEQDPDVQWRSRLFSAGKREDGLQASVFVDGEIAGVEIGDETTLLVGHRDADIHEVDVPAKQRRLLRAQSRG